MAATETEIQGRLGSGDAESGTLLMRTDDDGFVPASLLRTAVRIQVTGLINRVTVRQQFTNDTDDWAERVYVFPLPENAAVDHLQMQIGERVIKGIVKERKAANAI